MHMVKFLPRNEQEFKYLQLNLIVDQIDDYIGELKKHSEHDLAVVRQIAGLRVFKKNFVT